MGRGVPFSPGRGMGRGYAPSPENFSIFELKRRVLVHSGTEKNLLLIGLASRFWASNRIGGDRRPRLPLDPPLLVTKILISVAVATQ